jgi:hypothetical protein
MKDRVLGQKWLQAVEGFVVVVMVTSTVFGKVVVDVDGSHIESLDGSSNWGGICLWKGQECCICSDCWLGYKGLLRMLEATQ